MRWLVFIVAVAATYPVGRWLRRRPVFQVHVWTLVGVLPFLPSLDMALVSYAARPGDTKGFEVALIDWVVLVLFVAQSRPVRRVPYQVPMLAYLGVAILSAALSNWPLGAFGYVWKVCRMYFVFAVLFRAGRDARVPAAVLRGLMIGISYEGALAAWQHWHGVQRATGSFAHGNTLGMAVNLVAMAPLALLFAGRATLLTAAAPVAAAAAGLFTLSRGALLFFGIGAVAVYAASALRAYSVRKAAVGLAALVLALVVIPVALAKLASRSKGELDDSMEVRRKFERAASLMVADHPVAGVGPNHFTVMLMAHGYGDRAGLDWTQRRTIVHNVYWLTAAEMGYAGFAALMVLFLAPLGPALRYGLLARRDRRGDVLVGLGVGLLVFYAHGAFEWAWRITQLSYAYWMVVGVVAILSRQLRREAARPAAVSVGRSAPPRAAVRAPAVRPALRPRVADRRHSWRRGAARS